MSHFQNITVTDAPTQVLAAGGNRFAYLVQNPGPNTVWVWEDDTVVATDAGGFRLMGGQVFQGEGDPNEPLFAVCVVGQTQILQIILSTMVG